MRRETASAPQAPHTGPAGGFSFDRTQGEAISVDGLQTDPSRLKLGVNQAYEGAILQAAERTGLSAAAIASIIDAEATKIKGSNGVWNPNSRSKTSSAVGLTQCTEAAWQEMAETKGSLLHGIADKNGWLDKHGKLQETHFIDAMALRVDPYLSIVTGAEYDAKALRQLQAEGLVPTELDDTQRARYAYLAHHEGVGGAAQLLTGTLHRDRARSLYAANFPGETKDHTGFSQLARIERGETNGRPGIEVAWEETYADRIKAYTESKIRPAAFLEPALTVAKTLPQPDLAVSVR
ncbi:hypothetical protein [Roseiterribacter gracilis]|uniref:Transglycosylase SLT domain-containing protein n=1 Tax=Roseiterribacter gracilis TaxID=2812848 RepID=A0A8S8XB18_9PROT|nr:hypothetical protein TMPK1_10560 [Rhodospirillales bacterium TMPK1]